MSSKKSNAIEKQVFYFFTDYRSLITDYCFSSDYGLPITDYCFSPDYR